MPDKKYSAIGDSDRLARARRIVYSPPYMTAEPLVHEAICVLNALVTKNDPAAMHQLGQIYWEGLLLECNESIALELFSKAVSLGYPPALISLGAMLHAKSETDADFEVALYYYRSFTKWKKQRSSNMDSFHAICATQRLVHIGEVGLNEIEFLASFKVVIDGVAKNAPITVLRKINDWRLKAKQDVVEIQRNLYATDQKNNLHINPRKLPLVSTFGNGYTVRLTGDESIKALGLIHGWSKIECWIPLNDFGFSPAMLPSFYSMQEFGCPYGHLTKSALGMIKNGLDIDRPISNIDRIKKFCFEVFGWESRKIISGYKYCIVFSQDSLNKVVSLYCDGYKTVSL